MADTGNRRIQVLNVISTDDIEEIEVTADDPSELNLPHAVDFRYRGVHW